MLRLRVPHHPFQVVANPPYAIATQLVRMLLSPGSGLTSAHLVLQRRVARHLVQGGASGSVRWARRYRLELGLPVPRTACTPATRVDLVVLVVRRR